MLKSESVYYNPSTGAFVLTYGPIIVSINESDEDYDVLIKSLKTYSAPTTADEDAPSDDSGAQNNGTGNFFTNLWARFIAFFNRIGTFFKNLFK